MISKHSMYLVMNILQIHAQEALAEYGDPEIWATVNWGGVIMTSRKTKRQQLNETFYFKMAIS